MIDLNEQLERWLGDEIITTEQAEAMRQTVIPLPAPADRSERRIPLVTEVLGYVGAALALFAVVFLVAESWEGLSDGTHAALFASLTIALLVAGAALVDASEPAIRRLSSVLWCGSVVALGGTVYVLLDPIGGYSEDLTWVVIGLATSSLAVLLLHRHHSALQHVTFFAAVVTAVGAFVALVSESEISVHGLAIWAVGGAWLAMTRKGILRPPAVGMVLATFAMLMGSQMAVDSWDRESIGLVLGLASAGILASMGVVLREKLTVLLGGVGIFWFVPQTMFYYLGDEAGGLIGLFVSGLLLIGLAVWSGRRRNDLADG